MVSQWSALILCSWFLQIWLLASITTWGFWTFSGIALGFTQTGNFEIIVGAHFWKIPVSGSIIYIQCKDHSFKLNLTTTLLVNRIYLSHSPLPWQVLIWLFVCMVLRFFNLYVGYVVWSLLWLASSTFHVSEMLHLVHIVDNNKQFSNPPPPPPSWRASVVGVTVYPSVLAVIFLV